MNKTQNLITAENYYHHLLHQNFEAMEKCLHPEVVLIGPLAELSGKAAVASEAKNLSKVLKDITIRATFSTENKVMLAYDFSFPAPVGLLKAAVLMEFTDQLIAKIELFFDARVFAQEKDRFNTQAGTTQSSK